MHLLPTSCFSNCSLCKISLHHAANNLAGLYAYIYRCSGIMGVFIWLMGPGYQPLPTYVGLCMYKKCKREPPIISGRIHLNYYGVSISLPCLGLGMLWLLLILWHIRGLQSPAFPTQAATGDLYPVGLIGWMMTTIGWIVHLFNGLKGNGCPLSMLGWWLLMETPLPWHATTWGV